MAAGLVIAALGCGGDDDSTGGDDQATEASTADSTPSEGSDTESDADGDEASSGGLCVAVASVDLPAGFEGELKFGEAKDSAGRETCIVPIDGAEGEGLIVKVTTAERLASVYVAVASWLTFAGVYGGPRLDVGEQLLQEANLFGVLHPATLPTSETPRRGRIHQL